MACGNALAQTPPPSPAPAAAGAQREALPDPEPLSGRSNQRTERIQIEDAGSRVDELRVGGQTQNISVQPKTGNLPAYEVQSPDGARSRAGGNAVRARHPATHQNLNTFQTRGAVVVSAPLLPPERLRAPPGDCTS